MQKINDEILVDLESERRVLSGMLNSEEVRMRLMMLLRKRTFTILFTMVPSRSASYINVILHLLLPVLKAQAPNCFKTKRISQNLPDSRTFYRRRKHLLLDGGQRTFPVTNLRPWYVVASKRFAKINIRWKNS